MEREDSEEHETQTSDEQKAKDSKRKKKTSLQIEMLEMAYAENSRPSEAMRVELSSQLGLTNRQIQMWYCNRRLKDKKGNKYEFDLSSMQRKEEKLSISKEPLTFYEYPEAVLASEVEDATLFRRNSCQQVAFKQEEHISEAGYKRYKHYKNPEKSPRKKSQQTMSDLDPRAAASAILLSWGETFREDGPTLGFEFDPLPPGAFGTPIEPMRVSNSISSFGRQDNDPVNFVGYNAGGSGPKPTFKNVPRDKQLVVLAREQEVSYQFGAIPRVNKSKVSHPQHVQHAARMMSEHELDHVQCVQRTGKKPFATVPASRPPKKLLTPPIRACMKQDGCGFEDGLKKKLDLGLFLRNNSKASSNESIVSFIKQHQVSAYVKPVKNYYGNYRDGYSDNEGFEGDFENFEDSDGGINIVEADNRIRADQVSKKQKLNFMKDYHYGHSKCHAYTKWNSAETDESTGLIETDNEETEGLQSI